MPETEDLENVSEPAAVAAVDSSNDLPHNKLSDLFPGLFYIPHISSLREVIAGFALYSFRGTRYVRE
jgi:hypothetical protein